jgi:hypothetical protein
MLAQNTKSHESQGSVDYPEFWGAADRLVERYSEPADHPTVAASEVVAAGAARTAHRGGLSHSLRRIDEYLEAVRRAA